MRPRFGLMRGREFIMNAYSFSSTQESLQECYDAEKGRHMPESVSVQGYSAR